MDAILEKLNTPLILEDPDRCNHLLYIPFAEEITGGDPGILYSCSNCGKRYKFKARRPEPKVVYVKLVKHIFHDVPREIDRWEWVLFGMVTFGAFLLGVVAS